MGFHNNPIPQHHPHLVPRRAAAVPGTVYTSSLTTKARAAPSSPSSSYTLPPCSLQQPAAPKDRLLPMHTYTLEQRRRRRFSYAKGNKAPRLKSRRSGGSSGYRARGIINLRGGKSRRARLCACAHGFLRASARALRWLPRVIAFIRSEKEEEEEEEEGWRLPREDRACKVQE